MGHIQQKGLTQLHLALKNPFVDGTTIVEHIIQNHSSFDWSITIPDTGNNLLQYVIEILPEHASAKKNTIEIIKLLAKKINLDNKNKYNETALDICKKLLEKTKEKHYNNIISLLN